MGLFGPYTYKAKNGKKYYLHAKVRGKATIYYFSEDPTDSLWEIPAGYEVVENPKTGLPFLRKKKSFGIFGIFGKKEESTKE
ncbi:MAG: hypothetical protein ACP5H3_00720 [Candidatus Aenigmatarchaeota archaeon]